MMKRVAVLTNLFRRKLGVHPVLSPRQILFGKTFETPLCKIRELVMVYNVKANNRTLYPRAFYAIYSGPNDDGTGHSVFKFSTKQQLIPPKLKPVPMPEDIIGAVNEMSIITNKIHLNHFNCDHHTSQQDHFGTTQDNS